MVGCEWLFSFIYWLSLTDRISGYEPEDAGPTPAASTNAAGVITPLRLDHQRMSIPELTGRPTFIWVRDGIRHTC